MLLKLSSLLVVLASCGPVPDLVSSQKVSYYFVDSSWTKAEIDVQEQWFIDQLKTLNRYPNDKVLKSLEITEVYLYNDKVPCQASPTGYCNGYQDGNLLYVVNKGSPANSALTHEIAHWLQQSIHGIDDYDHTELDLWSIADSAPK